MKVKSSSRLKISRSNMSLKGEERRNLWLEKYRDNSEKFKTWKASRNYSYFFSHGKSFGICRVVITGLPGSGKATLLFTLKTLLEETKGKSETFLRFVPFFFSLLILFRSLCFASTRLPIISRASEDRLNIPGTLKAILEEKDV